LGGGEGRPERTLKNVCISLQITGTRGKKKTEEKDNSFTNRGKGVKKNDLKMGGTQKGLLVEKGG